MPLARGLAKALGGHIVLVGVIPTPGQLIAEQGGAIGTYVGSDHARLESEAKEYLEAIVRSLAASGLSAEASVRQGKPAAEIGEAAREHAAAAVVMATHGRTGPGRWVFGSVAEAVVAASPVPVLVQRDWQPLLGEPLLDNPPTMIVPLDGSAFAEQALEPAARLAEALGGRLILVRVEDNPTAIHAMTEYLPTGAYSAG